ncbi:arginine decarboxylase, partial [bacterium]|nr:arginine decarboxylase [bacterium]
MSEQPWSVADSADLYRIEDWGAGFFRVNGAGHVAVTPAGVDGPSVDLADLTEQLRGRGLALPLLLRFPDIIRSRVHAIVGAFDTAIEDEKYEGGYTCVYPIKVNQQRAVVEAVVGAGNGRPIGLEAGSKPELLAALAMADRPGTLLVLNGYKDVEFIETALLA